MGFLCCGELSKGASSEVSQEGSNQGSSSSPNGEATAQEVRSLTPAEKRFLGGSGTCFRATPRSGYSLAREAGQGVPALLCSWVGTWLLATQSCYLATGEQQKIFPWLEEGLGCLFWGWVSCCLFVLLVCFAFFFFFLSDCQCKPQFSSSVCVIVSLGGISVTGFLGCW